MECPTFEDFPSTPNDFGARYRVTDRVDLVAFPIEYGGLPRAENGFLVYVFVEGDNVGSWQWTDRPDVLRRVMDAFRRTTSPDYVPDPWHAPGGEPAMLRPPIRAHLGSEMEVGLPSFPGRLSVRGDGVSLDRYPGPYLE